MSHNIMARDSFQGPPKRQRLPTLEEVLMRKTRPPLDLYCFYIFLREEMGHDALDFWLDVQQHENLCRAYFKDMRKDNRSIHDVWPEFETYARRHGSLFTNIAGVSDLGEIDESNNEKSGETWGAESRYRDVTEEEEDESEDNETRGEQGRSTAHDAKERSIASSSSSSSSSSRQLPVTPPHGAAAAAAPVFPDPHRTPAQAAGMAAPAAAATRSNLRNRSPGAASAAMNEKQQPSRFSSAFALGSGGGGEIRRISRAPTVIPRNEAITQEDIRESGERIFARYLVTGAEKEVYLPSSIRLHDFPSQQYEGAPVDPSIPDYFHVQKNYIFKALEEDAFVRFLKSKAFSNLTRLSSHLRLFAGLFCLWCAFVVAFTLIFLDYKPKVRRLYTIIPFFLCFYFLFSSYYSLSPLLVLLNRSETQPFKLIKIREPFVQKVLRARALLVMLWTIIATAVLVVIFWAVPGHRL